ncbi:unnamed protein product [Thelazia callipaeda]|uniref:LAM_G_DOMAIN domain-containing protein n=1 Tax=Thelazia callipaeda TaxID=103827 RepID=A0A0N5CPL6_THECL|nr:unnamed protein product [Thelazia callipaeda]
METGICVGGAPKNVRNLSIQTSTVNGFQGCIKHVAVNNIILFDTNLRINQAMEPLQFCEDGNMKRDDEFNRTAWNSYPDATSTQSITPSTSKIVSPMNYVAQFDEISFVKVRAPNDYNIYLELVFLAKPQKPNGLVYFLVSNHHFFAVYLQNAYLLIYNAYTNGYQTLRYDYSSQHPLSLDKWHRIDDQQYMENRFEKNLEINDKESNGFIYIGGAPNNKIPSNLPIRNGFSGCLKMVIFLKYKIYQNGQAIDLLLDTLVTQNVNPCGWDVCTKSSCKRQAECFPYRAAPHCKCQFPTYGALCEKNYTVPVTQFRFEKFSYLKLFNHNIMKYLTDESLNLKFMILIRNSTHYHSPHSEDQILIYTGEHVSVGDYMSLMLSSRNELKLTVDLGSGPIALTHPTILKADGIWRSITLLRHGRRITLSVDEVSISSESVGPSTELNVYDALYIGGLHRMKSPHLTGFTGCIRDIQIGHYVLASLADATEAVNIMECLR